MTKKNNKPVLTFDYINWEGVRAVRHVKPLKIWYGKTEYHKDEQWFLKAMDLDKNAERDFALKDIIRFI